MMNMTTVQRILRGLLAALACLLVAHTATAQVVAAPGARLRVLGPDRSAIATGAFVRAAGDTVVLVDASGTTRAVIMEAWRSVEVSRGMHRRTGRGIGLGFLFGALGGAAIGAASYRAPSCRPHCWGPDGPEFSMAAGAVLVSVPGMIIGGILGHRRREEWAPVSSSALRATFVPTGPHRAALGATLRLASGTRW